MIHFIYKQVLWFYITVHNFSLMAVTNGRKKLSHYICSFILTKCFLLKDCLKELTTGAELLDDVKVFVILKEFIELNDIWMINNLHNAYFILNHFKFLR